MATNDYVQLDPAVIEQVRQMDLLSYLKAYEPSNLVKACTYKGQTEKTAALV